MSVVAKILVVINLLLAVVFLGASATYLGVQENYMQKWQKDTAALQQEIDVQIALNAKANTDLKAQREKTVEHERQATRVTATFEAQEQEFQRLREVHNQLLGQYERLSQTATDLQSTIDTLNEDKNRLITEKDGALGEKRTAIDEKNNAVTEQKRLENEILQNQDMIAELEKRLNAMADKLAKTELVVALYKEKYGEIGESLGVPAIAAVVAGVNNDLNIVLLSVGRDDKVQEGYEFTIYRGSEYVATIVVDKVEKDHCSGFSKKELERLPIQVGDKGTTRF